VVDVKAEKITTSRPDYSLFENNCQNFVRFLLDAICPEADVWSSVESLMNRLSTVGETFNDPLPGAYPQSVQSTESNSSASSFTTPATSESHEYPLNESIATEIADIQETELFGHSSSHSSLPAVAASLSLEGQDPSVSSPSTDDPAPLAVDPALFQSDRVLPYDIDLAKQAQQAHQLGLGGFSAVYLVPSYCEITNACPDAMAGSKKIQETDTKMSTLYRSSSSNG
jgi:hypothetical protein